jgi:paired amphipathic helix protein Sin3a
VAGLANSLPLLTSVQDPAKAEAYVRLFKKDDPTFEFNTLDRVKRWRAYVASYTAAEPTEEVDPSRVHHPYLRKRLAKAEDLAEDERHDTVTANDRITVNIGPVGYAMTFIHSEPFGRGGVQYLLQPDNVRAGSSVTKPTDEFKSLNDTRRDRIQEKLVRNNTWMKDLSRDDVDSKKSSFKQTLEQAQTATDDDVEMEEA